MMKIGIFTTAIFFGAALVAAEPVYKAHDPGWEGLWIWAEPVKTPPALDVDLRQWLEARPGAFGQSLVNRIMGNGAITGYREILWRLDDGNGKMLFPAGNGAPVLKWENWGMDFNEFDYPAAARELAERMGIGFKLVASTPEIAAAAAARYPGVQIVAPADLPAKRVSVVKLTADPVTYLERRPVWFRKRFTVKTLPATAEICVTANERYRLWIDGGLIGSGSDGARAKTFDVAGKLTLGEHELLAEVVPGEDMSGFMVNFRYGAPGAMERLNTGLDWECRAEGEKDWQPVISTGFEGAGARFRLKEPWGYRSKLEKPPVKETVETCAPGEWSAVADGVAVDPAAWKPKHFPATLELKLARPTALGEVRVAASGFAGFRLEYFDGSGWKALTPDIAARDTATELAFSPREVERLRLIAVSGTAEAVLRGVELCKAAAAPVNDFSGEKPGRVLDKFWEAPGRAAENLSIADSGAPFGNACRFAATNADYTAYHRLKPVTGGELIVEFDFKADSRTECLNLGVMPRDTGTIDHDTTLVWLMLDGAIGKIKYFANNWQDAASFEPGKWHHLKLRVFLSGDRKNTFNLNIDGGAEETVAGEFRNPVDPGDATAGTVCVGGRKAGFKPGEAVWIDNVSIRAVPAAKEGGK